MTHPAPHPPRLPIRQLQIDLSAGFDRHWFKDAHGRGDAFRSAYYNALSMTFPSGEQFFIDSVKRMQATLAPSGQAAQEASLIDDFCAQEATHRRIHAQFNQQLERQGLKNRVESRIVARCLHYQHIKPIHHLGITAAYEHYTAVLSDALLRNPAYTESMIPPMRQLWCWHALEETEHKAVAFDLYTARGGSYRWRIRYFIYTTLILQTDLLRQTLNNLWHDGTLFQPTTWLSAAQFFFGRPSKGGGWVWVSSKPLLAYFRKTFHPNQQPSAALAQAYANSHTTDWRVVR